MTTLLLPETVGERLNVSPGLVYKLAREGRIPSIRIGTALRFLDSDVEDFIASSRSTTPRPTRARSSKEVPRRGAR